MNIISNDKKERKVFTLKNFDNNNKVVQHNDLIQGVSQMDLIPLKIFELCVSAIDVENPPKDNTIYLSKEEMFSFFDVSDSNKHSRFKKSIERLQKQAVFQIKQNNKGKEEYISIVPIPTVKWNNYDDLVTVKFNEDIMPYLIDLKENFTQYLIFDIAKLNSKYSIVLYKWITMNYNIYEKYNNKKMKNPFITIEELRKMTDTVDQYERFDNFENRIIKSSLDEINKNTRYEITYEKVRKGRKYVGINFFIDTKFIPYPSNFYDKTHLVDNEISRQESYIKMQLPIAYKDKYIKYLIKYNILKENAEDIVHVYDQIVPLYERIDENFIDTMWHNNSVSERHIRHISTHLLPTEENYHSNIVRYLKLSVDEYFYQLLNRRISNVELKEDSPLRKPDKYESGIHEEFGFVKRMSAEEESEGLKKILDKYNKSLGKE